MRQIRLWGITCAAVLVFGLAPPTVLAQLCAGFCVSSPTLTEQLDGAESVALVKWLSGKPGQSQSGSTEFEVIRELHKHECIIVEPGARVRAQQYSAAKPGDTFLLLGWVDEDAVRWGGAVKVTPATVKYAMNLPSLQEPSTTRLSYFLKHLESPDPSISEDVFRELEQSSIGDLISLTGELPRRQLRNLLSSATVPQERIGKYALLLGLCGTDDDEVILEKIIQEPVEEYRPAISEVMAGYLWLAGDAGVALLEETKLKDRTTPFSETYAAISAVRFVWRQGDGRVSADRFRDALRLLLDRPELADLVIADLSRLKDWSSHDRVMDLYAKGDFNEPSIKRAIVRFTLAAANDVPDDARVIPAHAAKAERFLDDLKRRDPATVHDAQRQFRFRRVR